MSARKGLTMEAMKSGIKAAFKELGAEISFDSDRALTKYTRGVPLKVRELRMLPNGAVVWVWYKEHEERGPRINQAMRIARFDDGRAESWSLDDGSSFGAEFTPTGEFDGGMSTGGKFLPPDPESDCYDESGGEGEMMLYQAIPLIRTPKKPKKRTTAKK